MQYNQKYGISVWVMVDTNLDGNKILAHVETMDSLRGYFGVGDGQVNEGKVVSIGGVYVNEEDRGKGYGMAIIHLLLSKLKLPSSQGGEGASGSCLMAGGANPSFYAKMGYKLCEYELYAMSPEYVQQDTRSLLDVNVDV
ncbi:hypothetical protein HDU76_008260, partial [Blyttiomyces sp. JEL0837]